MDFEEDIVIVTPVPANTVVVNATTASSVGPQGPKGDTGATGTSGTIGVTSPITNSGTSAAAQIGIDQTALSLTASQVSGVAKLASSNAFTGSQQALTPPTNSTTSALSINASPTTHVAIVNRTGGNPSNGNALLVTAGDYGTDANPMDTTFGISGYELGKGTIKATHFKPTAGTTGSDANASVLSLRANGAGTAAQGIFFDAEDGGTTGKILNLRNAGADKLVLTATGQLQVPATAAQNAGIVLGGDTQLYRSSANILKTYNTAFYLFPGTASTYAFYTSTPTTGSVGPITSDFSIAADGKHAWGAGVIPVDTFLYRNGVNSLITDGAMTASTFSGVGAGLTGIPAAGVTGTAVTQADTGTVSSTMLGTSVVQTYIQATAPTVSLGSKYTWWDTSQTSLTLWIEDGT